MDSNLTNIEEYYREVVEDYPHLSLPEVSEICRYPFKFVKSIISSGILRDIRLQYFGVFKVSESKIKYLRRVNKENLDLGKISEDRYNKKTKILDSYEAT